MNIKIMSAIVICICMLVGIIMSVKYLKPTSMWVSIILLLIGLIATILYLVFLVNGAIG